MTVRRLTDADVARIVGGTPRFDLAPGPATRALLARHVLEAMSEAIEDRDVLRDLVLLAGGLPPDVGSAAADLATFNSRGVSGEELGQLAEAERAR